MGTASNPAQRRLSAADVDDLARSYVEGSTLNEIASLYSIHRTTVIRHLDRLGIVRRRNNRKMTDRDVKIATDQYRRGLSLREVAAGFEVDASTLAREFRHAGVPIRPRRG